MKKCAYLVLLVSILTFCQQGLSAQLLFVTSFEPDQGYPSVDNTSIVGQPATPPSWWKWNGGNPTIAKYNAISGGQSARLWGTSTGAITFNTDAAHTHVWVEGYLMPDFSNQGANGSVQMGLLADVSGVFDIGIRLNENGTFVARTATGNLTADNIVIADDTYYHVAIDADYVTGEARIYLGTTTVGNRSVLTDADLVYFGGESVVNFGTDKGFAEILGIIAGEGAQGFFDDLSVRAIPEPASVAVLLGAGCALLLVKRRRKAS